MKTCSHENIVKYLDSYLTNDQLWVVMELMEGGNLAEILEHHKVIQLTEQQMKWIVLNVRTIYGSLVDLLFLIFSNGV
jgi:protein-serine/threonine kinase